MGVQPATKWDLLLQFSYLQVLDILTTRVFLLHGVKEANLMVRLALGTGAHPLAILVALKAVAIFLAVCCIQGQRLRLLARVNAFFAALVVWNMLAIILSSPAFAG